jgi:YD repeat-containing protein
LSQRKASWQSVGASERRSSGASQANPRIETQSELGTDPLKITRITDPFGRAAQFTYTAAGQLASITDVVGLTSSFVYGASDFIASMTTPYGTTTFRHDLGTDPANARFVEATDPLGETERLECSIKRSGSRNGSGRSRVASTTVKIAVVAPTPRASVRIATALNAGWRRSRRVAYRRSCRSVSMVLAWTQEVAEGLIGRIRFHNP